jgi:hypothetical protein
VAESETLTITYVDLNTYKVVEAPQLTEARKRKQALIRLWEHAVSAVEIVHQDVSVQTEIKVRGEWLYYHDGVEVQIYMRNLRDTSDMDSRMMSQFHMTGHPRAWPGTKLAQEYVAGLWTSYMVHESPELVTFRKSRVRDFWGRLRPERVVDPHENDQHQRWLSKMDLEDALGFVYGVGPELKQTVDLGIKHFEQEVLNEMDPWLPGT